MTPAFLTIKWGTEFNPEDLNMLKRAAFANTSQPVRFICLTDDAEGLDADIETYPIPAFDFYRDTPRAGVWPKISLFHPDLTAYADLVVFIDIDTVIVGPLDDLFDDPGDALTMLTCGEKWRTMREDVAPEPATGVMTYRVAHQTHIFETFAANRDGFTQDFTLEQQYVGATAKRVQYYPVRWIESFKYHLRRRHLVDLVLAPRPPAPSTKLVAFHGFPRPSQVAETGNTWARPPRSGLRRPKWLLAYWRTYRPSR